jgi:hypothetical protein
VKPLSPSSFTPHETRIVSYILRNFKETSARPHLQRHRISMDPGIHDPGGLFAELPRPIAQTGIASQSTGQGIPFDEQPLVPQARRAVFDFT